MDTLIIGGGMAYTFLKAQGGAGGHQPCRRRKLEYCANMLKKAQEKGVKMLLPVDTAVITTSFPDPSTPRSAWNMWIGQDPPQIRWASTLFPKRAAVCRRGEGCQDGGVGTTPWACLKTPVLAAGL